MPSNAEYINQFKRWVSDFIVDLNVCPFARREVVQESIRYTLIRFDDDDDFYAAFSEELRTLDENAGIETTLILLPQLQNDFAAFLNQAGFAQQILHLNGYDGVYQVANFHPNYVFADSVPDDAANFTNRSPCPALHLLREASLTRVIRAHKNAEQIPEDNIYRLRDIGFAELAARLTRIKE
jgi:hypothetical protein